MHFSNSSRSSGLISRRVGSRRNIDRKGKGCFKQSRMLRARSRMSKTKPAKSKSASDKKTEQNGLQPAATLLDCFWALADPSRRATAAATLTQHVLCHEECRVYVVGRLVKGLQSSRSGARQGFGCALGCMLQFGAIEHSTVIAEATTQIHKCPKNDKAEMRVRELAFVLCCMLVNDVKEETVSTLLEIVEKRKWLKEAAARSLVSLCARQEQTKMRVAAWCSSLSPNKAIEEMSPEEVALRVISGSLSLRDDVSIQNLDRPLAHGARCFPQLHVAWEVVLSVTPPALVPEVWKIVDAHASSGTLERRGAALVLAFQCAIDAKETPYLSPIVCGCMSRALRYKGSHLAPLAQRLARRLGEEAASKPDEWRVSVASSFLGAAFPEPVVKPLLEGVAESQYASLLVDLAFSGPDPTSRRRALFSLKARAKCSALVRSAALVVALRLAFFIGPPKKGALRKALGLDNHLAAKLANPNAVADSSAVVEFWALVADCFSSVDDKAAWLHQVAIDAFSALNPSLGGGVETVDLARLWALCELRYGRHDEDEKVLIEEFISKTPPGTTLEAAKRATSLLRIANGKASSHAARLVVAKFWANDCASLEMSTGALDYLVDVACAINPEQSHENEDNGDDEDDYDDSGDEEEDQEVESLGDEESHDTLGEEDEDIVLDAAGLTEFFGNATEAESEMLSERRRHRKSGKLEASKLDLQFRLRVLDLAERAFRHARSGSVDEIGVSAVRACGRFASTVRHLEHMALARDLVKRIGVLVGRLRSIKLGSRGIPLRTASAKVLAAVLSSMNNDDRPAAALVVMHACALAIRAFQNDHLRDAHLQTAISAYADALRDCLGNKRSGLRPQLFRDAVARAPGFAMVAFLPHLPDLIKTAPSAFLK